MTVITPFWTQPSHPGVIQVEVNKGSYTSRAVADASFKPDDVLAKITSHTPAKDVAYSTVQVSPDAHIELNSDLLYCNHSCDPNVVFDVTKYEVRAIKPINKGDSVTFFYPSSEWSMAQPFDCTCKSPQCLGKIQGAKYLDEEAIKKYWFNEHIKRLLEEEGKIKKE